MNYNEGFNLSDVLTNEKYRARAVLLFFVLIIGVLIILARTGKPMENNQNTNTNNNNTQTNQTTENNDNNSTIHSQGEENDPNSIYNRLSFIRLNNYEFDFSIDTIKKIEIVGKRFDNKIKMVLTSNNETYDCTINNGIAKAKINNEVKIINKPIVIIDYFDNNTLYTILKYSKEVKNEDNKIEYQISNGTLLNILPSTITTNIRVDNKDLNNTITVSLKNNKIYEININLDNLVLNVEDIKNLSIDLKYNKVGQIDDFELDF